MDSLLSEPSGIYPSLFSGSTIAPSATSTSLDNGSSSMPLFLADGDDISAITKPVSFQPMTPLPEEAMSDAGTPDPESSEMGDQAADGSSPGKKPTKKRKSWGQVLPEPKTNLPPRKRAKTEDEKEQRRVERVLRNRRAAQSSRERKRLEVEALEKRNQDLEEELQKARRENMMLYQQLANAQGKPVVITTGNAPVTLSQELFSTHPPTTLDSYLASQSAATINPVSLSPSLHPVSDTSDLILTIDGQEQTAEKDAAAESIPPQMAETQPTKQSSNSPDQSEPSAATDAGAFVTSAPEPSPDMTQRPAATLCPDLQCLSAEEPRVWTVSQKATPLAAALFSQVTLLLTLSSVMISACCRPMTQIAFFLKVGISIPPSPAILTSIIWLITTPSARSRQPTLTSTTSSTPMGTTCHPAATSTLATPVSPSPARPVSTLRLKMLRKILTCNPMLARPLKDATLRLLRSVCSEKLLESVSAGERARPRMVQAVQWSETDIATDGSWQNTATLPSQEVLLTLLWALRVEERRQSIWAKAKSMSPVTTMSSSKVSMPRLKRSIDGMCLDDKCVLPRTSRRKPRRYD